VIAAVLGIATLLASAVAWIYTAILFEPLPVGGWLAMAALSWLALTSWAALTFLASAATGSTMAAAGIGFVALIGFSLIAIVPAIDRFLPTGLSTPAIALGTGDMAAEVGARLATAIAGSVMLIGIALAGAVFSFRRREL
jgi:ABC-type transport system involved in multi-copper enzyme maturation permease subunit